MPWLRIEDTFVENEKISGLRDRTFRVHVAALCFCARNLTDGHLSAKSLKILAVVLEFPIKRQTQELIEAGLWKPCGDGVVINDYLDYNPDAETVKKLREERRSAGRKGAAARWNGNGDSKGQRQEPKQEPKQAPDAPVVVPSRPEKFLKAVTADEEIEREVDKIMRSLKRYDDDSRDVILSYARKLPLRTVAKVRESCELRGNAGAGYAVRALQSELAELEEVA